MSKGTHKPIEEGQRTLMNAVAETLDDVFNGKELPGIPRNKQIVFVLLSAKFGDVKNGRVNYISNGERADVINLLLELLDRFECRHPEEGGTKQ